MYLRIEEKELYRDGLIVIGSRFGSDLDFGPHCAIFVGNTRQALWKCCVNAVE